MKDKPYEHFYSSVALKEKFSPAVQYYHLNIFFSKRF